MKRREFITLLASAAAWPLAARAQQREGMRRIGVLMPAAADDRDAQDRLAAFLQGLQQSGWSVGLRTIFLPQWLNLTPNFGAILNGVAGRLRNQLCGRVPARVITTGLAANQIGG
jgi:hypothetical protein